MGNIESFAFTSIMKWLGAKFAPGQTIGKLLAPWKQKEEIGEQDLQVTQAMKDLSHQRIASKFWGKKALDVFHVKPPAGSAPGSPSQ